MMSFAFSEYQQMGGTSPEDVFNKQVTRAISLVTSLIFPNEPHLNMQGFKKAVVCAIDAYHHAELNPNTSSERIGDIALTYCTDGAKSTEESVKSAAKQALSGTGLLCGWL